MFQIKRHASFANPQISYNRFNLGTRESTFSRGTYLCGYIVHLVSRSNFCFLWNIACQCCLLQSCAGFVMEQNDTDEANYTATTEGLHREQLESSFAAKNMWIYGSPVVITVGTMGNLLSVVVMLRQNLRKYTTSLYLLVLAVVDTVVLYAGLLRHWIRELFGTDIRDGSIAACRIHPFVLYLAIHVEACIIVCVGIERMVAVFFPHKAKRIFTRRFAACQMAIIGAILSGVNSHYYWTFTLINGRCHRDPRYEYFMRNVRPWIHFCLTSLMPFLVMLVTNSAIAAKLIHTNHVRNVKLNVRKDEKLTSMTVILLSISVIFLLTTGPMAVLSIVFALIDDPVPYRLVWSSLNLLFYTNYSVNFSLYCVSAPRFRRELFEICRRNSVDARHARMPAQNVHDERDSEVEVNTRL